MSANQDSPRRGAALLIDVVGSSALPDFAAGRDRRLERLTRLHRDREWTGADYAVTAWDEFQSVVWNAAHVPPILLDIRRIFAPWQVYAGIGLGDVTGRESGRPVNEALSGPGFERARAAMDALKSTSGDKYRRLTRFRSDDAGRDELLNLVYGLHDSLLQDITGRQWETINAALELENQETVAQRLGVQPSTVTRNLKRGHFWQLKDTVDTLAAWLAADRAADT